VAALPVSNTPSILHSVGNTETTTILRRSFHSSQYTSSSSSSSLPGRRRRRESNRAREGFVSLDQNDDENDLSQRRNALQHPPVRDAIRFRQAASDLFDKLERSLIPMKAKNDPFRITRSRGEMGDVFQLDLGPKEGIYQPQISEEECIFE
jgi:hypothetical protein